MTKIKFIDARFADPDEDEFALKRRFEWHLRKLRALRDGVSPKVPGDFEDELRWNEDLIAVHLSEKDRTKVLRRARRVMRARAKVEPPRLARRAFRSTVQATLRVGAASS